MSNQTTHSDEVASATESSWRTWLAMTLFVALRKICWGIRRGAEVAVWPLATLKEAIPVGLLRRHEISAVVNRAYADVPDYYDPANYSLRVETELLPLLQQCTAGRRLLDLYAGQGREAQLFAEAGYRVTAVEEIKEVVEKARERAAQVPFETVFVVGDIENDTWQPPESDWDVVYTSLWMYATIPDRDRRVEWLKRMAGFPSESGVLVVSTTPRATERRTKVRYLLARFLAAVNFNSRKIQPGDHFRGGIFWHEFTAAEAMAEFADANLEVVESYDKQDPQTPATTFYFLRLRPTNPPQVQRNDNSSRSHS